MILICKTTPNSDVIFALSYYGLFSSQFKNYRVLFSIEDSQSSVFKLISWGRSAADFKIAIIVSLLYCIVALVIITDRCAQLTSFGKFKSWNNWEETTIHSDILRLLEDASFYPSQLFKECETCHRYSCDQIISPWWPGLQHDLPASGTL